MVFNRKDYKHQCYEIIVMKAYLFVSNLFKYFFCAHHYKSLNIMKKYYRIIVHVILYIFFTIYLFNNK